MPETTKPTQRPGSSAQPGQPRCFACNKPATRLHSRHSDSVLEFQCEEHYAHKGDTQDKGNPTMAAQAHGPAPGHVEGSDITLNPQGAGDARQVLPRDTPGTPSPKTEQASAKQSASIASCENNVRKSELFSYMYIYDVNIPDKLGC